MIKRIIFIITVITLSLIFSACSLKQEPGNADNVEIIIGNSEKYTTAEIEAAAISVKDKFVDFTDCELTKLYYDEERSDKEIKSYLSNRDDIPEENIIVFLSEYNTGSRVEMTMQKNSTYYGWLWIVVKNSETEEWSVVSWGY